MPESKVSRSFDSNDVLQIPVMEWFHLCFCQDPSGYSLLATNRIDASYPSPFDGDGLVSLLSVTWNRRLVSFQQLSLLF